MTVDIRIQQEDFDQGAEYQRLAKGVNTGAVVTFVGRVRDFATGQNSSHSMWLEHYPGMTEKVLHELAAQAQYRWPLLAITIIHRIGHLSPGDQIVLVGVSSEHRKPAFAACEFLIDFLKTQAPFWKREGANWVAAKTSDEAAAAVWTFTNDSQP